MHHPFCPLIFANTVDINQCCSYYYEDFPLENIDEYLDNNFDSVGRFCVFDGNTTKLIYPPALITNILNAVCKYTIRVRSSLDQSGFVVGYLHRGELNDNRITAELKISFLNRQLFASCDLINVSLTQIVLVGEGRVSDGVIREYELSCAALTPSQ